MPMMDEERRQREARLDAKLARIAAAIEALERDPRLSEPIRRRGILTLRRAYEATRQQRDRR